MRSIPALSSPARLYEAAPTGLWLVAMAALLAPSTAARVAREHGRVAYVFDADTFRLASGIRIKIAAIDAAEARPDHAKCAREIPIGNAAIHEVRTMLEGRNVDYQVVGRNRNRLVAEV